MSDDPSVSWRESVANSISVDVPGDAWHAGHVNDVLVLRTGGAPTGVMVATDSGGVWACLSEGGTALPLSESWDEPDLRCLEYGPDGDRHFYAGGGRSNPMSAPCATYSSPGRLEVVAVGRDGGVWHAARESGDWTPWTCLGGEVVGKPAVTSWGADRLDVFVVGTDRQVYHKALDGPAWSGSDAWEPLGGDVTGSPTVVSWAPGRLDVFAVGIDRQLLHKAWDGASWLPSPTTWEPLGGEVVGSPAAVSWGPERLDVFVVGRNRGLFHRAWDGVNWFPTATFEPLGGEVVGSPAAASWGPGRIDVVAIGSDGALSHLYGDDSVFSDWEPLGGQVVGRPALTAPEVGKLEIVVVGSDGGVYRKGWDGTSWQPIAAVWQGLDGLAQSEPSVASQGSNQLDVVILGLDGNVYHRAQAGGSWSVGSPWSRLNEGLLCSLYESDTAATAPLVSWRKLAPPHDAGIVLDVAVQSDRRRILLATSAGVWWSTIPAAPTSAGTYSWHAAQGLPAGGYSAVVRGPGQDVVVAAEGSNPMTGLFGLFRGSWEADELKFTSSTISGIDARLMERTVVASCDADRSVLYAAAGGPGDALLCVLRSADGGTTWAACSLTVAGDSKGNALPALAGNQSRYNNAIDVCPVRPATVALGWRSGPWISTDSGASWRARGMGWSGANWVFTDPQHLHGDMHAVHFDRTDPSGQRLYLGTDGGVAGTSDLGETFSSVHNQHLRCLQFQSYPRRAFNGSSSVRPGDTPVLAGGAQDNGNLYAVAGEAAFRRLVGGDGLLVCFINTGHALFTVNGNVVVQVASWDGGQLSSLGNVGITSGKPGAPSSKLGVGTPAQPALLATIRTPSARNVAGQLAYAVAAEGSDLYALYSDPDGASIHWEYLTTVGTKFTETITAVGSADGETCFIGTSTGRILSRDAATGFTLELPVEPLDAGAAIHHFAVQSAQRAFAILNSPTNGYLLRFQSPGIWHATQGLPIETLWGVAADPATNIVAVATDSRVYLSRDDGETWRAASRGLSRRPHCAGLQLHTDTKGTTTLHLTTYGRSAWQASIT